MRIRSELSILIFTNVAASGIRLPRVIARLLQASLSEILGTAEYETLKTAVLAAQAANPELAARGTEGRGTEIWRFHCAAV
jgi:hypothetical protein